MFDEKYGSLEIGGKSIPIEKMNIDDLEKYLKEFENKRLELINQQNDYLSKILS